MTRKFYRFPSPWNVAEYFNALSIFTSCEFSTLWNDCRVAVVDCKTEQDQRLADGYAHEAHGKEIPPAEAEGESDEVNWNEMPQR